MPAKKSDTEATMPATIPMDPTKESPTDDKTTKATEVATPGKRSTLAAALEADGERAKMERNSAQNERDQMAERLQKANKEIERLERENASLRAMVHKLEAGAPATIPAGAAYVVVNAKFPRCDTGDDVDGRSGDIIVVAEQGEKGDQPELQKRFGAKNRVFPVTKATFDELLDLQLARAGR